MRVGRLPTWTISTYTALWTVPRICKTSCADNVDLTKPTKNARFSPLKNFPIDGI